MKELKSRANLETRDPPPPHMKISRAILAERTVRKRKVIAASNSAFPSLHSVFAHYLPYPVPSQPPPNTTSLQNRITHAAQNILAQAHQFRIPIKEIDLLLAERHAAWAG